MFRSLAQHARVRALTVGSVAVVAALAGCAPATPAERTPAQPVAADAGPAPASAAETRARNVILIQGDGLGVAHRELLRLALKGRDGELRMNRMEVTGLVHTDPADAKQGVTDSAAAATAYSTGLRTVNGAVAVDPAGKPLRTLLERARTSGRSTGLVTTAQVTDASPAAFSAHVKDRGQHSEIARQILEHSKVDVVLGGGEDWWYPAGNPGAWPDKPAKDRSEKSRGTKGNLVTQAKELGYHYVRNADELADITGGKVLGLFANEEMFEHAGEGDGDLYQPAVSLRTMTGRALDVLAQDPDGFFLFIEEEATDEMAHHGNTKLMIRAGAALERTVTLALDFAARTPGTLVVVMGDHETGGLAIENVDSGDESGKGEQAEDTVTIDGSTLKVSVDWTTDGHTGAATPITASGPGAERLAGFIRNTDVHDAVLAAMG